MEDSSLNLQDIPQPLRTAVCGEELAVVVNRRRVLKSAELAVQKASFSFDRPVKVVFFWWGCSGWRRSETWIFPVRYTVADVGQTTIKIGKVKQQVYCQFSVTMDNSRPKYRRKIW